MISYEAPEQIDWQQVIREIRSLSCMTINRMSRICDMPPSTMRKIVRGATKEPHYATGAKILALRKALEKSE